MSSSAYGHLSQPETAEYSLADEAYLADGEIATDDESVVGDVKDVGSIQSLTRRRAGRSEQALSESSHCSPDLQSPFVALATRRHRIAGPITTNSNIDAIGDDSIAKSEEEGLDASKQVVIRAAPQADDIQSQSEGEGTDALERQVKRLLAELLPSPPSSAPYTPKTSGNHMPVASRSPLSGRAVHNTSGTPSSASKALAITRVALFRSTSTAGAAPDSATIPLQPSTQANKSASSVSRSKTNARLVALKDYTTRPVSSSNVTATSTRKVRRKRSSSPSSLRVMKAKKTKVIGKKKLKLEG